MGFLLHIFLDFPLLKESNLMKDFKTDSYQVLIVDDSEVTLTLVSSILKQAGFQVITAVSGEEALDIIKETALPHLALVDIDLPFGMDGFEFCRSIRELGNIPIIMLTAVDEEETMILAIEQYAQDYITKPVRAGELVARIRRVLRRSVRIG